MSMYLMRFVSRMLAVLCVLAAPAAYAQTTATIDWTSLNAPNAGALPNPSTATGSDNATTATVSYSAASSGAPITPILPTFVSYYEPVFGGQIGTLLMNFDNPSFDPNDKLTTVLTMNRAVTGMQFTVTDIDAASWTDAVEVYYDNGDGTWRNAANTPAFYNSGSAVTRTSDAVVQGWRGTANAAPADAIGNIAFDFGNTLVRRIRIVYFSYTGNGDPAGQASGITDLNFNRAFADLSLAKTVVTPAPVPGATATYRLTLTNAARSSLTATGVAVRDTLPAGFTFTSASGTGTFNPATGIWSPGSLARNESVSIDISGTVNATSGAVLTNIAEISASNQADPDSTPNNAATGEDDYATASLTVGGQRTAGIPPTLVCPNQDILFDWDTVSWAAGSVNNSYPLGTLGAINFALTNDGAWVNLAGFGGQSPLRQNTFTGGLAPAQFSLGQIADQANQAGRARTTITLPQIMRGAQFRLFDVDSAAGQFADLVTVEGRYQGATVIPVLTNGTANYVIGNSAYGDGASDTGQGNGNVVVTFSQPIDRIIISYGNHAAAPANPGQQGIALHDILLCRPDTTVVAEKTSRVLSDTVGINDTLFNVPGAVIEYCLRATNTGDTPATDVRLADVIPANMTYEVGSIRSGQACDAANTAEDDNNAGADETDPVGAQFLSGGEIRASVPNLNAGQSAAFTFRAVID